ncbi:hypothetical protein F5148DRAFT_958422, partial [Russula earlei]
DSVSLTDVADGATINVIQTDYHPKSGRSSKTCRFEDYGTSAYHPSQQSPTGQPWWPFFNSQEEFLFVEFLLECHLGKEQSERLLWIIHLIRNNVVFTFKNLADIEKFQVSVISLPYNNEVQTFDVPHCFLWEWATDLVQDSQLAPHFHWDAERIFRHKQASSTCIYHEPWSADAFWDVQVCGSNPLCFILYADKMKLSNFSTVKGCPVIACCANLPVAIQNRNGFGGG